RDCFERLIYRVAPSNQREVRAPRAPASLTQRDSTNWLGIFVFGPEQMFGNQKDHGILGMHRCPKQSSCVFGRARNDDAQTGIMCERRFVRLAVPQAAAGEICPIRRINHGRTFPIAERSPAEGRDIGDELVESWINEIDKLQLKDWAFAVGGEAAGNTENG